MHEIEKVIQQGVVLGIERALMYFKNMPYDAAIASLKEYMSQVNQEIAASKPELTSEHIPMETI